VELIDLSALVIVRLLLSSNNVMHLTIQHSKIESFRGQMLGNSLLIGMNDDYGLTKGHSINKINVRVILVYDNLKNKTIHM
jgi:hypothetical protein